MSGKRNVSVCSGHELANALYNHTNLKVPKKAPCMPKGMKC